MLKKILIALVALVALVLVGITGVITWAGSAAEARLAQTYSVEVPDIPVPWPLTEQEVAELRGAGGEGEELEQIALERAVARGEHIATARGGCLHCHGEDLAGNVIVEDPAMGRWVAPNISGGAGSRTAEYTVADWTRALRHGIRKDGTPHTMPSEDFAMLSDREVSDLVAFARSRPRVDGGPGLSELGPIFSLMIATGEMPLAADLIDHDKDRPKVPPAAQASVEFGAHLAGSCVGCHGATFSGGKGAGTPPDWPTPANLTPDETGLEGWTKGEFFAAIREGRSKDGRALNGQAMPWEGLRHMDDVEIEALYLYFQSLEPKPLGGR
jgi:mono/diheme cytochrome c family protein